MAIGIKRDLREALMAVNVEVANLAGTGGLYAHGLASEGFMGGYREALEDVALALNGVEPERWRKWREVKFAKQVATAAGGGE